MTRQEYLDLLVKTSREGGFPSVGASYCRYRGECGRKCVVGLLIPDEKYCPKMEFMSASNLLAQFPGSVDIPEGLSSRDLYGVQKQHDNFAFQDAWSHHAFVERLLNLDCFAGLTPSEGEV